MKKQLFYWLLLLLTTTSCGISKSLKHVPDVSQYKVEIPEVVKPNDSTLVFKDNFITKNKQQLYELYISGNPLQLGYNEGALTQKLMQKQERIFFSKVEDFVPSRFKQWFLRQFLKWYNRKMYLNIRNDFQAELYGLSRYASDDYNFVATPFLRSVYLNGAHDIGHALQDLMIVGCSSMAVWDENSEDGTLLLGRNFDFYVGDDFAEDKLIAFIEPEGGIPYMSVTWGGMTGVVSGMNKEGITVTINAGKSKIPWSAKTPISLVTKEILQHAKTIDEAIEIVKKRQVFVSESIMVGSAHDRKAVVIEVSPEKFGVYEVPNSSKLVCANHFQSEVYKDDERNLKQIAESHSMYRFNRMHELLDEEKKMNPEKMAFILRNRKGLNDEALGYGNEKALNQLISHHGIIFSPEKRLVWVSSNPYQLGEMVCYDLNEIFSSERKIGALGNEEKNISRDPFADSPTFKDFQKYRKMNKEIDNALEDKIILNEEYLNHYKNLNYDYWGIYYKIGKYYYQQKDFSKAKSNFEIALTKVITTVPDQKNVEKYLEKANKKLR